MKRDLGIATEDDNEWKLPPLPAQLQHMCRWCSPPMETDKGGHLGEIEVERLQLDIEVRRVARRDCA
jgi:hypothetical protein